MQTMGGKTTGQKQTQGSANPFARALAEVEKTSGATGNQTQSLDALTRNPTLGNELGAQNQKDLIRKQQEEALKAKRRKELHDRVNPVEAKDVFSARREQVKKEIDRLRVELKALAKDVAAFHKEVEITLMTEVGDPGTDGAYYISFFQKLRSFILLLRQRIKSARTWATQVNNKKKKKKRGKRPGLEIAGAKSEKTSTVFDMMHHERSNSYGGS